MKFLIFILFFIQVPAFAVQERCISTHLVDAMKLNKKRKELYAQMSNGESKNISNQLIRLEKLSLLFTYNLDRKAKKYQRSGVELLCLDFVDMKETPEFSSELVIPRIEYSKVPKINIKELKKSLYSALKKDFSLFSKILEDEIEKLSDYPSYNCMARHLFESLNRSVHLVSYYESESLKRGLKSPRNILMKNLKLQIFSLSLFHKLDKRAGKIQQRGVPIICNDVPAIPLYELSDPLN
jgi:hypothetical protein